MPCVDVEVPPGSSGVSHVDSRRKAEMWKVDLIRQLKRRDMFQHDVFRDIIRHCPDVASQSEKLKTMTGELACQVVALQQEMNIKEKVLEEQRSRLSEVQRSVSRAGGEKQDLQDQVSRVQEANAHLKQEYDVRLECHTDAERRLRQEKQRGSELLGELISSKQEAAKRLNTHNDKKSRARQKTIQKDLQAAQSTPVTVDTSPVFSDTCPKKEPAEKIHTRLLRSASATSPRILASIKELFERKRRCNTDCSAEQEMIRPARMCVCARLPARACHTLEAHEQCINAVRFSSNSDLLATGGTDCIIKLWDVQAVDLPARVTSLDLSSDLRQLLCCCRDDCLQLLDLRNNNMRSLRLGGGAKDGIYATAGSADGSLYIWSVTDGNLQTRLSGKHRYLTSPLDGTTVD
ncbi:hypothetical protein NHX12_008637 [Muraenolepis orangiensis]|uniref:Autophagy-related protein 16 domain-containing protein n=1 Tax=Muraenolepis orangiensis TaxID=630683 RepID=A0A9Q0DNG1_9TELE|nr:hypothetical protein NHX12_008637 [Muraenolepis orangiensis]